MVNNAFPFHLDVNGHMDVKERERLGESGGGMMKLGEKLLCQTFMLFLAGQGRNKSKKENERMCVGGVCFMFERCVRKIYGVQNSSI